MVEVFTPRAGWGMVLARRRGGKLLPAFNPLDPGLRRQNSQGPKCASGEALSDTGAGLTAGAFVRV